MAGEQLRVTEGKAEGERLAVERDVLIGRAADEPVGRLGDDPELSRRHARAWRGLEGEPTHRAAHRRRPSSALRRRRPPGESSCGSSSARTRAT